MDIPLQSSQQIELTALVAAQLLHGHVTAEAYPDAGTVRRATLVAYQVVLESIRVVEAAPSLEALNDRLNREVVPQAEVIPGI